MKLGFLDWNWMGEDRVGGHCLRFNCMLVLDAFEGLVRRLSDHGGT
jgi:hypothetical protein